MTMRKWMAVAAIAALAFAGVAAAFPHEHGDLAKPCDVCHVLAHASATLAAAAAPAVALLQVETFRNHEAFTPFASFHLCSSPLRAPPAA